MTSRFRMGRCISITTAKDGTLESALVRLAGTARGKPVHGASYTKYAGARMRVWPNELRAACAGVLWFSKIRPLDEWLGGGPGG